MLFAGDLVLIGFLALHAYRDGRYPLLLPICCSCLTLCIVESLDHYEVPFFGSLANRFVDDE
jgi:hypothetical protein